VHNLILANIAYHVTLGQAEKDYFLSVISRKAIKRREFLLKSGHVCKSLFYVLKGCLRVYHTDKDGIEHILLFTPEDWWCVDLYSFHTQSPASFNIDALEDTEVFELTFEHLEKLYEKVPKFERFFRILSQNGFIMHQERVNSSLMDTAGERYEQFQKRYPKLEQRIAQKQIAAYLGITPVFLSMIRNKK